MDEAETGDTLIALARAEAKLAELKARVAAHADDIHVGQEVAASSAANRPQRRRSWNCGAQSGWCSSSSTCSRT